MAFVTDTDLAATGAGQGANMVGFVQPGSGAVERSAMEKLRETVSVRDFGAKGDGTTDDTVAIQAALDAVEATGGGAVLFPVGDYKITATLDLPGQVSIEGQGQFSTLKIFGCDGINVLPSNVIGPRRVANLWFYGNGADANTAISIDLSGSDRAQGMVFEGIYIAFFGTGVRSRGLWHSAFRSVTMNQIHRGFYFPDRSVKVLIDDCRITCGGLVTGDGASIGVQVGDPSFPARPEDLQITKSIIYGFDKGVVWRFGLFGGITNCDLDACAVSGLELVTADGGFTFSDNWVQVNNTDGVIYGVNATAIGYTPSLGNIVISNNYFISVSAPDHAYGMFFGSNQANITVCDNGVAGTWTDGLYADDVNQCSFADNRVEATISIFNSDNVAIRENYAGRGINLLGNTNLSCGKTFGPQSTKLMGNIAVPAFQTTATVTFASLGLPDLPDGTYGQMVLFNNPAGVSRGDVWGSATQTDITVNVATAFGVIAGVSFLIEVF